jgi:uncharacterized cupin superfamily protein
MQLAHKSGELHLLEVVGGDEGTYLQCTWGTWRSKEYLKKLYNYNSCL